MNVNPEIIEDSYEAAMEQYNEENDLDIDVYPSWNSLTVIMRQSIEQAFYRGCANLIEGIYGGGHFNDSDLLECTTEEIMPLCKVIRNG